jgi:hypothetical protein
MNYSIPRCICHKSAFTGDVRLSFAAGAQSAWMHKVEPSTVLTASDSCANGNDGDSLMT